MVLPETRRKAYPEPLGNPEGKVAVIVPEAADEEPNAVGLAKEP